MVSDMTRCVHCLPLLGTLMLVASSLVLTPVWVAAQEVSEPSAEVSEPSAEDLAAELKLLQDVQAGMALALAACGDEPHCVTALHEQEMQTMQEELNDLMARLDAVENPPLLEQHRALTNSQQTLQQTFVQVTASIDRDALEGVWADQFVFDEFVIGPLVPFPNEDISLSRFEDLNQPLPIQ